MKLVRILAIVCAISFPGTSHSADSYKIFDLGILDGMNSSYALDINNSGQVAGASAVTTYGTVFDTRAVLWSNNAITDLGTLGGNHSYARGINDSGQVAGHADISVNTATHHAFLWNGSNMMDLGTLGGVTSVATGINNSGQVVGVSENINSLQQAFLWSNGAMTAFDVLLGATSTATDINDSGQVVGQYGTSGQQFHAFLISGNMLTDLGTFGGAQSVASGINSSGYVVGRADTADVIFDPEGNPIMVQHAFLWNGVSKIDLGSLGGANSWAQAINDSGQVVGFSSLTGDFASHAFIWDGGVMTDLNDLLSDGSGWTLTSARDINNSGQIVGTGIIGGQTHAFLMTPVPVPPAVWFFVSGLASLAGFSRRRSKT